MRALGWLALVGPVGLALLQQPGAQAFAWRAGPMQRPRSTRASTTLARAADKGGEAPSRGSGDVGPRVIPPRQASSAREAAYLAVLAADRGQGFVSDGIEDWAAAKKPGGPDMCVPSPAAPALPLAEHGRFEICVVFVQCAAPSPP